MRALLAIRTVLTGLNFDSGFAYSDVLTDSRNFALLAIRDVLTGVSICTTIWASTACSLFYICKYSCSITEVVNVGI